MPGLLRTKRVYDEPSPDDGFRVLVDRLWPRGLTKEAAALDEWLKDAAPSADLRTWFHAAPGRFDAFAERYEREMDSSSGARRLILDRLAAGETVTLLYGAKDTEQNHALVLARRVRDEAGIPG